MKKFYLAVLLCMFTAPLAAQLALLQRGKPQSYLVNEKLQQAVAPFVHTGGAVPTGTLEFTLFLNDEVYMNTFTSEEQVRFNTYAYEENDTLHIVGFAGLLSGIGFHLHLVKDSCIAYHLIKHEKTPLYKLDPSDKNFEVGLYVPADSFRVVFDTPPVYRPGNVISGVIEMVSRPFYEKIPGGLNKYKTVLRAYFRTPPLK